MKKDPLNIVNLMLLKLNLLNPDQEYSVNELKILKDLDLHWITIKKYLKIISLVQKYAPIIKLNHSKFEIEHSEIFNHLNEKEKCVIFFYNKKAFNEDSAIEITQDYESIVSESLGYLFEKTESGKYYLNDAGLDIYKSIKQDILALIHEEKDIEEIFSDNMDIFEEYAFLWEGISQLSNTHEGAILMPREKEYLLDNVKYISEIKFSI